MMYQVRDQDDQFNDVNVESYDEDQGAHNSTVRSETE